MPKQALLKLSHLIEFYDWPGDSVENIIKSVLTIKADIVKKRELGKTITEVLGIEIPKQILESALQKLLASGQVKSMGDKLLIPLEIVTEIESKVRNRQELANRAIGYWIDQEIVMLLDDPITDIERDNFISDLETFLKSLFLRHGVECLNFLNNKSHEGRDYFDIDTILNKMQWSSNYSRRIGTRFFPEFLTNNNADIQRYLLELLETAVNYLINVCDPSVLEKLKTYLNGKILYLDTSVIYRLLEFNGSHRAEVVLDSLKLCQQFGMELHVNSVTLDELKRRLRYDLAILKKYPTPTDLAAIGLKYSREENFVSRYWNVAKTDNIPVDVYIASYSHIEDILVSYGIHIEPPITELSEEFTKRCAQVEQKLNQYIHDKFPKNEKGPAACYHDAYNIVLIDASRTVGTNFLMSPSWFITTDHTIIKFQKNDHEFNNKAPVAILPSELLGILGFTRPTEKSYAETFLGLFSRSFIPSQTVLSNELIQRILGRVNVYKGRTPELAERILSDQLVTAKIACAKTDEDFEEVIYDALVVKSGELVAELKDKEGEFDRLANKLKNMENEKLAVESELNNAQRQLEIKEIEVNKYHEIVRYLRWSTMPALAIVFLILMYLLNWNNRTAYFQVIALVVFSGVCYIVIHKVFGETASKRIKATVAFLSWLIGISWFGVNWLRNLFQ